MMYALAGTGVVTRLMAQSPAQSQPQTTPVSATRSLGSAVHCEGSVGSPYIPVDSWIYPTALRLFSLGYGDSAFIGIRPWTRDSLRRALEEAAPTVPERNGAEIPAKAEAVGIYRSLMDELTPVPGIACGQGAKPIHLESAYTLVRGISGNDLRDSYHLGSSIVNDYGRPYGDGVNTYTGLSGYAARGRFAIYARGELQTSPTMQGYSAALAGTLAGVDVIRSVNPATGLPYVLATTPYGNTQSVTQMHLLEAYASANLLNHIFSFGKVDQWLGPAQGSSMAYSNNADNIYAFQINRIEPLRIPFLSPVTGPFRYEFLVGPVQGHSYIPGSSSPDPADNLLWGLPGAPWMHVEKISFKPKRSLEIGFSRTIIWGGTGHEAVNLHSFIRSFVSTANVPAAVKNSDKDPGARFSAFDLTYRLPGPLKAATFYFDSEVHDSVSPPSNPAIMAYRAGLYVSHMPHAPRFDVRVEGVNTDPGTPRSIGGQYMYWEYLQKQGYTNKGALFGDWIGREGKGGQAWTTYHLSPRQWVQVAYRRQKNAKDFIPGGTTLDEVTAQIVERLHGDWELNADFSFQKYQAPVYLPGSQKVTVTNFKLTRYFK